MNIFILHEDPEICAEMHCDRHISKMPLELAQMLSTAHRILDGKETVEINPKNNRRKKVYRLINNDDVIYSATHSNHPCSVWIRENSYNYEWAYRLFVALSNEYTHRYRKIHLSYSKLNEILSVYPTNIKCSNSMTEWAMAMPEHLRISGNAVQSYRNYYNTEKRHLFAWKNRPVPYWIKDYHNQQQEQVTSNAVL